MKEVKMFTCRDCGHTITVAAERVVGKQCRLCLVGDMVPVSINFETHTFEIPEQ